MSAPDEASPAPLRSRTTLVSALVAIGVVVGGLAYDRWVYPHLMQRLIAPGSIRSMNGFYAYALVDVMVRYFAPYALVLLVWGRTTGRRLGAALCALATGAYMWVLWVSFSKWIFGDQSTAAQSNAYDWANLLVVSTGIAFAWGIARRWGRLWVIGLAAAPLLAALAHELMVHSRWWRTHVLFSHGTSYDLRREMVFIAPAVVAAVVCWLIDAASTRRTTTRPVQEPDQASQTVR